MKYLLDTNICSAYLRRPGALAHRFIQHASSLAISSIVLGELYTWAFRRHDPDKLLRAIDDDLLNDVAVLPFDAENARHFGELRAALLASGTVVNPIDLMIASVALRYDLIFVTNNTKHFENIPGLSIEDWIA